jgi:hypothetical protein
VRKKRAASRLVIEFAGATDGEVTIAVKKRQLQLTKGDAATVPASPKAVLKT